MDTRTLALAPEMIDESTLTALKTAINSRIEDVMVSLPAAEQLSSQQQREMIARYTAVLEGNFIYWMTAAYLAVQSEEARPIIVARAPSASALIVSEPRRTPESSRISTSPPTASTIPGSVRIEAGCPSRLLPP